ncbi:MAG: hypothetical protein LBJ67_17325 [Planctomycetaceae bacterium]|nr:hypothetical protein [Planctomycetaceae bacterium]
MSTRFSYPEVHPSFDRGKLFHRETVNESLIACSTKPIIEESIYNCFCLSVGVHLIGCLNLADVHE